MGKLGQTRAHSFRAGARVAQESCLWGQGHLAR
jgi:hypothetical protein